MGWIRAEIEIVVCEAASSHFRTCGCRLRIRLRGHLAPQTHRSSGTWDEWFGDRLVRVPPPRALSICSITSSTAVVTFELERRGEVACTPVYSIGSARYINCVQLQGS